jgi:hypothetical protein
MSCGQQVAMAQPAGRPVERPAAHGVAPVPVPIPLGHPGQPKENKWLWPAAIGLAALLALLIGAVVYLKAPGSKPVAHLAAPGKNAPVPLMAGRPTMPKDIYDWLDHLRQTEDMKNELSGKQQSQLMVEFTKLNGLGGAYGMLDKQGNLDTDQLNSPTQTFADKIGDLRAPWRDVIKYFESMPPPAECQDLAQTYDHALDEVSGQMGDLADIITSPGDTTTMVDKLTKMQGASTGTIDKYLTVSDDEVAQICNKYNTKKWFKITNGPAMPMSSGLGGGTIPSVPTAPN